MRINFDQQHNPQLSPTPKHSPSISLQIESPIYNKIRKSVSPHNYKQQVGEIQNLMSIPQSINKFLHKEIESQIASSQADEQPHYQSTFIMNKVNQYEKKIYCQKNPMKNHKNINKKKSTNNVSFNYKKHNCSTNQTRQAQKQMEQMAQVTQKPKLYPSRINKKVAQNRKTETYAQCLSKKYSVYEHLYRQMGRRQMKKQLKRAEEEKKLENQKKINKQKPKLSIYRRAEKILQKKNTKQQELKAKDLTTGRRMFKPDLNSSRQSYTLFVQSLSRQKFSCEKTSVEKENLQRNSVKKRNTHKIESKNKIDEKVISYFLDIFYPENEKNSDLFAINQLSKQDFVILQPFIHEIDQLENQVNDQETTVSSQKNTKQKESQFVGKGMFREKFTKFYHNLNLYDREVLRKKIRENRKIQHETPENSETHRPFVNIRSTSLDNLAKGHQKHIYYV